MTADLCDMQTDRRDSHDGPLIHTIFPTGRRSEVQAKRRVNSWMLQNTPLHHLLAPPGGSSSLLESEFTVPENCLRRCASIPSCGEQDAVCIVSQACMTP